MDISPLIIIRVYYSYRQEEPSELAELLAHEWDPVVEWFCKRFACLIHYNLFIYTFI